MHKKTSKRQLLSLLRQRRGRSVTPVGRRPLVCASRRMWWLIDLVLAVQDLKCEIDNAHEDQKESEEQRARVAEYETLRLRLEKTIPSPFSRPSVF